MNSHAEKCTCETCKNKALLTTLADVKKSAEAAYTEGYNRGVKLVNSATSAVSSLAGEAVGATVAAATSGVATVKSAYNEKVPETIGATTSLVTEKVNAMKGVVEEKVPGALGVAQSAVNVGWGLVGAVTQMVKDNMPPISSTGAEPSVEVVEVNQSGQEVVVAK